jgi:hypothetical protein
MFEPGGSPVTVTYHAGCYRPGVHGFFGDALGAALRASLHARGRIGPGA